MKNRILTWTVSLFLISIFLLSCGKEESPSENGVRPVKTMLITTPESTIMRVFPGVTLATNETVLSFQIPGQIIKFPVLEGDRIVKGTMVAELDPVIYQEKVNETSANLTRDKANFARATKLVNQGYLSVADYDRVRSAYLVSQANYNVALNDLNNTKLLAPFTGVIAKKNVNTYEYVIARQSIALLQDKNTIDMEINVPENIMLRIKSNQIDKEKIFATFDSIPNQIFSIKLKEFSTQADPQTQTFRIIFTMDKPKNINILPGMTVSIHASLGNNVAQTFYLIPSSAVFINESNQPSVWLIDKSTMKVKEIPVTTSSLSTDQIRVLNGLKPGDLIVTSGANFIHAGQEVKVLK